MGSQDKVVIGWLETVDLPDWDVFGLTAKVDTGAKTSAIHVENIVETDADTIEFDVVLSRLKPQKSVHVRTQYVRQVAIRNSIGKKQVRYVVETVMVLGNRSHTVQFTLVSRKKMIRRMLIGRRALEGHYIVDVSQRHVLEQS